MNADFSCRAEELVRYVSETIVKSPEFTGWCPITRTISGAGLVALSRPQHIPWIMPISQRFRSGAAQDHDSQANHLVSGYCRN